MNTDVKKYAERKMPLFNLAISLWQHNLALKNTIGVGFTQSVFTHSNGTCDLNASQTETDKISNRVLDLIKAKDSSFKDWYEKAKVLNKKVDELLAVYQNENVTLDAASFQKALDIFTENFGYCTIVPYWILYGIEQAMLKGETKDSFGEVLTMFEELKGETRYPQMGQVVINKYFEKAAQMLGISPQLATCLHPDE